MKNPIYETALEEARIQVKEKGLNGREAPTFAEIRVWKPYTLAFRYVTKAKKKVLGRMGK